MDDTERKIFVQLDDDMPAQRANALEMLREHMKKKTPPRFFRDIAQEDETAGATIAALQAQVQQEQQLNAQNQQNFTQQYGKLQADYARLKRLVDPVLWAQKHWRFLAPAAAVPVIAALLWCVYPTETRAHHEAVDDSFNALAAGTPWHAGGDLRPVVRTADGQPYWVTARFDANAAHYNAEGEAVTVQCVHLFADPAVADAGVYLEPHPYSLFGFGWLTWPERGVSCKPRASINNAAQMTPLPPNKPQLNRPAGSLISSAEAATTVLTHASTDKPMPAIFSNSAIAASETKQLREGLDASQAREKELGQKLNEALGSLALAKEAIAAATGRPPCPLLLRSYNDYFGQSVSPDSRNCIAIVRDEPVLSVFSGRGTDVAKGTVVKVLGINKTERWFSCNEVCQSANGYLMDVKMPDGRRGYLDAADLTPYSAL
jgi:hypothetical protein